MKSIPAERMRVLKDLAKLPRLPRRDCRWRRFATIDSHTATHLGDGVSLAAAWTRGGPEGLSLKKRWDTWWLMPRARMLRALGGVGLCSIVLSGRRRVADRPTQLRYSGAGAVFPCGFDLTGAPDCRPVISRSANFRAGRCRFFLRGWTRDGGPS